MPQSKEKKIRNTLKLYEEAYDEKLGISLVNDFLQLSQILKSLKENDIKAFNAFYALIAKNLELEDIVKERGSRISKLQKSNKQSKSC